MGVWVGLPPIRKKKCGRETFLKKKCSRQTLQKRLHTSSSLSLPLPAMDAKLAERMKRLRLQQEEAEEAEWSSSSRGGQSVTGLGGPSPRPSETSAPVAPEVPCMDEDEPGMHAVGLQMQEDSATERPPLAPAAAQQVAVDALEHMDQGDPFEAFHSQVVAPRQPAPEAAPAGRPRDECAETDKPLAPAPPAKAKRKKAEPGGRGEDTFTRGSDVPVLVIGEGGKGDGVGNWRQSAQDASSVLSGLVRPTALQSSPAAPRSGRAPKAEGKDVLLSTMAKKNSKILTTISPRHLGAGSIWEADTSEPAPRDFGADERGRDRRSRGAAAARSKSGETKKKIGGRSTSVPAQARQMLLDNNVLAMSTGSIEDRADATRRICGRVKTIPDLRKLVDAGVVRPVASLLAEPTGMNAAVDALLPLCCHIGPSGNQDVTELIQEFCFEIEAHGVAEKLSAILCWSSTADNIKGKIATVMFYLAKEDRLANRIIKQDGALKALVQLLDSENDAINSSAAAALANITYWASEPVPRYSHLRILAAV